MFTCTGIDGSTASGLLQILNRIAAARLDVPAVLGKLDEIQPGPDALRAAAAQRRLTPAQRDILVRKLSGFRGSTASVMCPQGDLEAGAYAEQFMEVLRQAGWSGLTGSRPEIVKFAMPVSGVLVMVSRAMSPANRYPYRRMRSYGSCARPESPPRVPATPKQARRDPNCRR